MIEVVSSIALYVLAALGLSGASLVGYAVWARRDRIYRERHKDFLEQKSRVQEHISDTKNQFNHE